LDGFNPQKPALGPSDELRFTRAARDSEWTVRHFVHHYGRDWPPEKAPGRFSGKEKARRLSGLQQKLIW
jgi:hypothetical protein